MSSQSFVDFFSGAGGLSLGLGQSGLDHLYSFDSDEHATLTHQTNQRSGVVEKRSIADVSAMEIIDRFGRPDVVVGGPPCQGFSTKGTGRIGDPRNNLVLDYISMATQIEPSVILMENVPGVLGPRGKALIEAGIELLTKHGYVFEMQVIRCVDLGVPQTRRRAIVAAWKPDLKPFDFVALTTPRPPKTLRDAIHDLPEPPDDGTVHPRYFNHSKARMSALNVERISHVPPGGGRLDVPAHLQMACHVRSTGRHLDVFGRLEWDSPAATITAMFDNFTRGRYAHPDFNRNITNREGARIQTFPDSYQFQGPKKEVARQIGNAVPPLLGKELGLQIKSMFK
ncbi:DNA cytosine methyltransferase [Rhodococcus sp. IEGM 1381]|uniref:DNA cytosine methyltransferase n=1 Tax=Rhodococcus sp. IEGM 1381 TaxID=3047085 RepID=UPI0024B6811A|nr:DNA cytosine methyltransferase [Rhodococcus sp. IEGM 1381]MDI9896003.1 DNA cytosine methyltransferase [Rhodococcus sp. IEGM 1381]